MIREVSAEVVDPKDTSYSPIPEEKAAPVDTKGRIVPRRDNKKQRKHWRELLSYVNIIMIISCLNEEIRM